MYTYFEIFIIFLFKKNYFKGNCAGLNPLLRTIQGNDLGTTACPPCGVWHWVTPLQDTEFHKPT